MTLVALWNEAVEARSLLLFVFIVLTTAAVHRYAPKTSGASAQRSSSSWCTSRSCRGRPSRASRARRTSTFKCAS